MKRAFRVLLGLALVLPVMATAADEDIEHCVEDLVGLGVGANDALKECRRAHPHSVDMAHCSIGLNRRGVRADHSVRECRNQGARARAFVGCVIDLVDVHHVRTDLAVKRCR